MNSKHAMDQIAPTVFRYPQSLFAPGYFFGGMGLCLVIFLFLGVQRQAGEPPSIVYVVLMIGAALNVGIALGPVFLLRPISVDQEKVTAYFLSQQYQILHWSDVVLIEKIRTYNSYKRKYWNIYFVRGPKTKIRFQEGLIDLEQLIQTINGEALQRKIPMEFVDRGAGTRFELTEGNLPEGPRSNRLKREARTRIDSL